MDGNGRVTFGFQQSPSADDGLLSLSALFEATGTIEDDYDDDSGNDNNWELFLFSTEGEE